MSHPDVRYYTVCSQNYVSSICWEGGEGVSFIINNMMNEILVNCDF